MAGRILTVTLNAALDLTYEVDQVDWHGANRVRAVHALAGGKGVNVARVLQALGWEVAVAGLAGGPTGAAIRQGLAESGLLDLLVEIAGESRRTLVVADAGRSQAALFNEPGPQVSDEEWAAFLRCFRSAITESPAVVLAGSLPPGVPTDAYAVLTRAATEMGVATVLDADGAALRHGLGARPALVKPNESELASLLGRSPAGPTELLAAAAELQAAGAQAVVVSLGAAGLIARTLAGCWRATPPEQVGGNPTGAGDAAVAQLTAGLITSTPWPELLADAAAISAAAVLTASAGSYDPRAYRRIRAVTQVEELRC
ncbi:MAG: hexose kinase [Candidatus Dormibacteraeota bacterium]|nr:hexose kinase [Candidatus Dormibacteraeota bacterium]